MCLCVLYLSENKQRLVPLTAQTDCFYNSDEKCLQRGTDWAFKYSGLSFIFKGLKARVFFSTDLCLFNTFIEFTVKEGQQLMTHRVDCLVPCMSLVRISTS